MAGRLGIDAFLIGNSETHRIQQCHFPGLGLSGGYLVEQNRRAVMIVLRTTSASILSQAGSVAALQPCAMIATTVVWFREHDTP